MTYQEIEAMDVPTVNAHLATSLLGWKYSRVDGSGDQRRAIGNPVSEYGPYEDCPAWTHDCLWAVIVALRNRGYRVNIVEVAPHVGEVIVVEHSSKHPKQERVEVTTYYGISEGMQTCGLALCKAALMAIHSPMRLKS